MVISANHHGGFLLNLILKFCLICPNICLLSCIQCVWETLCLYVNVCVREMLVSDLLQVRAGYLRVKMISCSQRVRNKEGGIFSESIEQIVLSHFFLYLMWTPAGLINHGRYATTEKLGHLYNLKMEAIKVWCDGKYGSVIYERNSQ